MSEKPANPHLIDGSGHASLKGLRLGDLYLMAVVASNAFPESGHDGKCAAWCFDRVEALLAERERRGW